MLNDLDISLKVLKELYPDAGGKPYMFFDEIQEVPKWELFIKRGRTITYEVVPFTFI